jgi:cytosine/adenosine deaminase-related metal-dependent hydrolase
MSLGKSDSDLPPDSVIQPEDIILQDSQRLISKYHDNSEDGFMQIWLALCSPFSVSTSLIQDTAQLVKENNVMLHTQLAETEAAGYNIGLAVNGSASNDCSNRIQEVRQSLLQQRLRYGAKIITAKHVIGYATTGSASV